MRRYALNGGGEPKKSAQQRTGEGVFFKERTYAHELFKIGVLTMFLIFPFCFLNIVIFNFIFRPISCLARSQTRFS